MITKEQAIEYLEMNGVNLPEFVLDDLLILIGTVDECLHDNYMPQVADLIELYLLTLISFAQYTKYVSSERAPNGASRSYRFASPQDAWGSISNMLAALDPKGCTASLVPESPYVTHHAALFVGVAYAGKCGGY